MNRLGRHCGLACGAGAVALLPLLSACVLTQDRLDPALEVPQTYRAAHGSPNAAPPPVDWWRTFRSAELSDLMRQANVANFSIAAAVARIVEADAQARIAGAALLPTLDATANAEQELTSGAILGSGASSGGTPGRTTNLDTTALNASYTIDFWGHNRALLRAADYTAVGKRFDRDVVALTQLASVANTFF